MPLVHLPTQSLYLVEFSTFLEMFFDGNIQKLLATVISTNSIAELVYFRSSNLSHCSKTTDFEKIKTISTFKPEGGDFV